MYLRLAASAFNYYDAGSRRVRRATAALIKKAGNDRGDSPIPTVIIIVGLAMLAVSVALWARQYFEDVRDEAPAPGTIPPPAP